MKGGEKSISLRATVRNIDWFVRLLAVFLQASYSLLLQPLWLIFWIRSNLGKTFLRSKKQIDQSFHLATAGVRKKDRPVIDESL